DHGDYLGDYGLFGKGLHYDCILRTPLLLRGPGVPEGRTEARIASLVDVAPTLLDLAGVAEPPALQGLSLRSGLDGASSWPRDAALTENDDDMAGLRLRTLTTADWTLTLYAGSDYGELYDRRADPEQRRNLWRDPAHATTKGRLLQRLADHMLCAVDGSNGRTQLPAPPVVKHAPLCCEAPEVRADG
ncbi:MAG: sulfatase, partial [Planctomycetota bacterium]